MRDKDICPLCQRAGIIKYLKSYQINLDEAVVLCENKLCTYPLSVSSSVTTTYSRKLDDVGSGRASESKAKVPDSQLALQTKVASLLHKTGLRLQKDAIGIQTGSPQLKKKFKKDHVPHKRRETTASILNQTGINGYPSFQLETGSHSFQSFKSFTETNGDIPGASCNGSDGGSEKDSLLNSSGDSLESSSIGSSNGSLVDNLNFSKNISKSYQTFQLKGSRTQNSPSSLPNLSSLNTTYNGHSDNIENNVIYKEHITKQVENKSSNITQCNMSNFSELTKDKVQETNLVTKNKTNIEADHQNKDVANNVPESLDCLLRIEAKRDKATVDSHKNLLRYPSVFPQWRNQDALCWLDVILCLAVHNETLKSLVLSDSFDKKNLIYKLFQAHMQACKLVQLSECKPVLKKCENSVSEPDPTRESDDRSKSKVMNQTQPCNELDKENNSVSENACLENIKAVDCLLNEIREEVWNSLKNRLKCEKGQNESPVFAFPLLLRENHAVEGMFKMVYRFEYKCSTCGRVEDTDHINTLPTLPGVVKDFNIGDPKHTKKCPQCGNAADTRNMVYKNLPECLLMHFTEGLPDTTCEELQFGFHGNLYIVTGFVQYINKPDHFIAWLRNPQDNTWFKCDDLRPTVCHKRIKEPKLPCSQIHMVMWERFKIKSKICRQVAIDTVDSQPDEAQRLEKKAMVNLNFVASPQKENQRSKIGNGSAFNNLKLITDLNDDFSGHMIKANTSVKVFDSSPCSTFSTGSCESLLLPNFIAFTTENEDVLRPIPMTVSNVAPITCNSDTDVASKTLETKSVNAIECLEKIQSLIRLNASVIDNSKVNLELLENRTSVNSENIVEKCQLDLPPCSKISGPKSIIRPSTVFCVPKKSNEIDNNQTPSNVINHSSVGEEAAKTTGEETVGKTAKLQGTSVQKEINKRTNLKEKIVGATYHNDLAGSCKNLDNDSKSIEKDNISDNNEGLKSSSRLSQNSRFKVPFNLNRKACLSKDAFLTLETNSNSRSDSSGDNTPVSSTSSPALSGNITYLNSVKQYLLSRTTGRTDPKFKFEGLNLKTSSSNSSFSLSEFGFPVSNSALSVRSEIASKCNSPTLSIRSDTLSRKNSSKTSELVNELIQRLEQSPFNQSTLKRKVEKDTNKSPKKKAKESHVEEDTLSNGSPSFKENTRTNPQKRLPGGKSMRLVRKQLNQAEKVNTEQKVSKLQDEPLDLNNQMLNGKATKCESESVLQDLYEALNIPFSNVDATMTDIMSDVGDILDIVNVDDLVPSQHHVNRLPSCHEGSSAENQKLSDWYVIS